MSEAQIEHDLRAQKRINALYAQAWRWRGHGRTPQRQIIHTRKARPGDPEYPKQTTVQRVQSVRADGFSRSQHRQGRKLFGISR